MSRESPLKRSMEERSQPCRDLEAREIREGTVCVKGMRGQTMVPSRLRKQAGEELVRSARQGGS